MHKIVFSGKILPGHDPARVRAKLLSILGLPPEQAERIFSGKPRTIKKDLSPDEVDRYLAYLTKHGIGVDIEPPVPETDGTPLPTLFFDLEPEDEVKEEPRPAPKPPADPPPQAEAALPAGDAPAGTSFSSTAGPRAKPIPPPPRLRGKFQ